MLCSKTSCQQTMKTWDSSVLGSGIVVILLSTNFYLPVRKFCEVCENNSWIFLSVNQSVMSFLFFFFLKFYKYFKQISWYGKNLSVAVNHHLSTAKLSLRGFTIFSLYIPLDRTWSLCRTYLGWSCPSLGIGHWVPEPWCLVHHELRALCTSYQHLLNDVKWLNKQFRFTVFFEKLHIIYNSLTKV